MAKGMSMEEFRAALSSDATVENEKLKEKIKKLEVEVKNLLENKKELEDELAEYKDYCRALGNRCFVHTKGVLCLNCDIPCPHSISDTDLMEAIEYMKKNNIPMTKDKIMLKNIDEFFKRRRAQKTNINNKKENTHDNQKHN